MKFKYRLLNKILDRNENISFIFGCPRGGTTWLWSLLESHPDVVAFLNDRNPGNEKYITSESGIYITNPRKAKKIITKWSKNVKEKTIIEKTPAHTLIYPLILKDFPYSKNIVILRNPLAIANSMIQSEMKAFESFDIYKSIDEIKKYYKVLEKICVEKQSYIITYEQLIANTELVFAKVLNYLDLESSGIEDIILDNTAKTKVSVKGAFRSGTADSYLNELTPKEINKIKESLSTEIEFYNSQYERYKNSCCK